MAVGLGAGFCVGFGVGFAADGDGLAVFVGAGNFVGPAGAEGEGLGLNRVALALDATDGGAVEVTGAGAVAVVLESVV